MYGSMYFALLVALCSTQAFPQDEPVFQPLDHRYALVIGVSAYQDPSIKRLNWASKDARDIYGTLLSEGRFAAGNIELLTDSQATREAIRKGIEKTLGMRAKKDDLVLIYFAGHGSRGPDTNDDEQDGMDEYIIPVDCIQDDNSTAIRDDEFALWIRNLASKNILIIFDCCHSGGGARQRGIAPTGLRGKVGKDDFLDDLSEGVPKPGVALLAACRADQNAGESSEFKNGVFTHALLNAISPRADLNHDNLLTDAEVFACARNEVLRQDKGGTQEPTRIGSLEAQIDLFYLLPSTSTSGASDSSKVLEYKLRGVGSDENMELELRRDLVRNAPRNAVNIARVGDMLKARGMVDAALYYFELANSLTKSNYHSTKLAELSNIRRDFRRSLELLASTSDDDPIATRLRVEACLGIGDTLTAIQTLNASIARNPLQKVPYLSLFYIYLHTNQFELAESELKRASDLNPSDLEVRYARGRFEQVFKHNSLLGDSVFRTYRMESDVQGCYGELTKSTWPSYKNQLDQILDKYPFDVDFQKAMIEWAILNKNELIRRRHWALYQFYGILASDSTFVQQQANLRFVDGEYLIK